MNASKQNQYDKMMNTPVPKLIISLSIPTVISMMVTNIYNLVDTAFVGTLGTSASGAVGVVFGFMSILQALGFMCGQGSGSILARRLGAKDIEEASNVASTGFFSAFGLGTIAAIICALFLDPLVIFLGSTPTIAPFAKAYIFFLLITAPFCVTNFTLNNLLRYEGKAFFGMIALMAGAVLNILGDVILMFGLKMGIAGAGLATALSQVVSFAILLSVFLTHKTQCTISLSRVIKGYKATKAEVIHRMLDIWATGLPSLLRQGLNSLSTIVLNMSAAVYGDAAVAAMSIVSRVFFFVFAVAIGVGQGFQPVSGFSYGARRYDRLKKAFSFTTIFAEILVIILGGIVFLKAEFLIGILRDDPEVVAIGTRALKLQCIAVVLLPICMVTEMMMQSTGKRLRASILSCLRNGIIFVPVLLLLSYYRGLSGIQEAQSITYVIALFPSVIMTYGFFRKLEGEKNEV